MEIQKLRVLNDNVLVEGIVVEMRDGVYTGVTQDDKPQEGKVLMVGPGKLLESGERVPSELKTGMHVLFNEHSSTKYLIGPKTYYLIKEEDVVGYES